MIVLFLTGMVAMIMMRTLRADLRKYNQLEPNEEAEETGWKLVHGDVFRPPSHPMMLSVLVGSGVQVFGMAIVTMCKFTFLLLVVANSFFSLCCIGILISRKSWWSLNCCGGSFCYYGVSRQTFLCSFSTYHS